MFSKNIASYRFVFQTSMKPEELPEELLDIAPSVNSITLQSILFSTFETCFEHAIASVQHFLEIFNSVNSDSQYKVITEHNPMIDAENTFSKAWTPNELVRIWIVRENFTPARDADSVNAKSIAKIFESDNVTHMLS